MKLANLLHFNGPDATCHSLRVIAEKVRTGEIKVKLFDVRDKDGYIRVDLAFQPDGRRTAD